MCRLPTFIRQCTVAIVAVALATLVTWLIPFKATPSYLLLLLAVLVTAWYSRPAAALGAMAVAAVISVSIFNDSGVDRLSRLALFLAASVALTWWAYHEKRLLSAIQESTPRFQLLMENVIDYAIIVTNANGAIVEFSSGARRIIGLTDEDKGRSLEMIFPPDESGAFDLEIATAKMHGDARDERWHLRKDGSPFWGYGILTALRDSNNGLKGYVKILRDLTEQKRSEDERSTLLRELEKANGLLEQVVATLAHDIRAPLGAILGWTAMRKGGHLTDDKEVDHAFDVIERNTRKQLELMEALLELYRIKSEHAETHFKPCDLSAIVYDAVETIRPAAEQKELTIHVFDCQPRIISGNATWLTQIFTNLLQNAVKFTPAHGTVTVTCRQSANSFVIDLTDTGIGIPGNLLPNIFLPFKRGNAKMAGAGLGLAIVRELVNRHGGNISARSAGEGKGATFTVELPLPALTQIHAA